MTFLRRTTLTVGLALGLIGLLALLLQLAPAESVSAANVSLRPFGATIHVPVDYDTIQEAIDAAEDGDTILVEATASDDDAYVENLRITKGITLSGGWDAGFTQRTAGRTTLDADGEDRAISITCATSDTVVTIVGFRIINGDASVVPTETLATRLSGGSSFMAEPEGSAVDWSRGVAAVNDAATREALRGLLTGLMANGQFAEARADYANLLPKVMEWATQAAQYADQLPSAASGISQIGITNTGGGIYSWNASLTLFDNVIANNRASTAIGGAGGGIFVGQTAPGGLRVISNTVSQNIASVTGVGMGGGLTILDAPGAVISGNLLIANRASVVGGVGIGGAAFIEGSAGVRFINNQVWLNAASTSPILFQAPVGGGLYARHSDQIEIRGNSVRDNLAGLFAGGFGGGIYLYALNDATVMQNEIVANGAAGMAYQVAEGGGVGIGSVEGLVLTDNLIGGNMAGMIPGPPGTQWAGGGGLIAVAVTRTEVARNTFVNNSASLMGQGYGGGAVFTPAAGQVHRGVILRDNLIISNTATFGMAVGQAGGVYMRALDVLVQGNRFESNQGHGLTGEGIGGGLQLAGGSGPVISSGNATIDGNFFIRNSADAPGAGWGGALAVQETAGFTITNNVLVGNRGRSAGGMALALNLPAGVAAEGRVANNTLVENRGPAILLGDWRSAPARLANNIIVSHTVGITVSQAATATISYTLFDGNAQDVGGSGVYTNAQPIAGAPAFVNPAAGDFHITIASAARDAGDPAGMPPAPATDYDGAPRPFGVRVDAGAFEWRGVRLLLPILMRPALPTVGWAIGHKADGTPAIVHTSNGGQTWQEQDHPVARAGYVANDVSAVDEQTAWVALGGGPAETHGALLHTTDGGATWVSQTIPTGLRGGIKGIKALSRSVAWAVSLGGVILHTTDAGNSWNIVPHAGAPITQANRIDAFRTNDVWIADASPTGALVHSTDGGITWRREELWNDGTREAPLVVHAFWPRFVWASGTASATFYQTRDGGNTWTKVVSVGGLDHLDDLCAASTRDVWGVQNGDGVSGFIWRVYVAPDGTPTATNVTPAALNGYTPGGVTCVDARTAWVVAARGVRTAPIQPQGIIMHTVDGTNWVQQNAPADISYWKLSFVGARR